MRKEHLKAYLKFRKALDEKNREGVKSFIRAWFSINDHNFLLPILQEIITDWHKIEEEVKQSEADSKKLLEIIHSNPPLKEGKIK